jgi:hypothetical protein
LTASDFTSIKDFSIFGAGTTAFGSFFAGIIARTSAFARVTATFFDPVTFLPVVLAEALFEAEGLSAPVFFALADEIVTFVFFLVCAFVTVSFLTAFTTFLTAVVALLVVVFFAVVFRVVVFFLVSAILSSIMKVLGCMWRQGRSFQVSDECVFAGKEARELALSLVEEKRTFFPEDKRSSPMDVINPHDAFHLCLLLRLCHCEERSVRRSNLLILLGIASGHDPRNDGFHKNKNPFIHIRDEGSFDYAQDTPRYHPDSSLVSCLPVSCQIRRGD